MTTDVIPTTNTCGTVATRITIHHSSIKNRTSGAMIRLFFSPGVLKNEDMCKMRALDRCMRRNGPVISCRVYWLFRAHDLWRHHAFVANWPFSNWLIDQFGKYSFSDSFETINARQNNSHKNTHRTSIGGQFQGATRRTNSSSLSITSMCTTRTHTF